MARITETIEIDGQLANALFDTGTTFTYVRADLGAGAPGRTLSKSARVGLGGKEIEIRELRLIEGLDFSTDAVPIDDLGYADGHRFDVLIGALTMERWEIKLDPKSGALDLDGLRRREFTEY